MQKGKKTLRDYDKELEESVKKRTKQLEEANKKLEIEVKEYTEVQKKLNSSLERLKRLDRMKDDFIAVASHELRTPMTLIKGYASMILEEIEESGGDSSLEVSIRHILDGTDQLIALVNDMLDVAKIESGNLQEYELAEIDLVSVIERVMHRFMVHAKKSGIDLNFTKDLDSAFTKFGLKPLEQVLSNLIDNAIKYCKEEGGKVHLNLTTNEDKFVFSIEDNGAGVPEKYFEQIFEKFGMGESPLKRKKGGTGLGLTICKSIVEHFGGAIWVKNSSLGGACFMFTIPMHPLVSK